MTELASLLLRVGVRRVLIVDDAYDSVPTAFDLLLDENEWTEFFDDLEPADREALNTIYPGFEDERADRLRASDDFVQALWQNAGALRDDLVNPLFARYRQDTADDLKYLNQLRDQLMALGLTCETAGRHFATEAVESDLLVIDLFLGSSQQAEDIDQAVAGVRTVVSGRPNTPPLVILMSRSHRLYEKRVDFRDRAGLFESGFRIIGKDELLDAHKLKRILTRLAHHYQDSLKLAAFLNAWRTGVERASVRAADMIRRLDLTDLAQVRQLLLEAEGVPTGSYLVDVFDRAFQYEVESQAPIIDAALAVNSLTADSYPPPYVEGSKDLQHLVNCALFQHPERLRLPGSEQSKVAFGDLLWRKRRDVEAGAGLDIEKAPLSAIGRQQVLAVLSPACDLQRQGAKRVLLLVGEIRTLGPNAWSYKEEPTRTPVLRATTGETFWIKWDLKHIETVSHEDLSLLLEEPNGFVLTARLRESHALELQQKLLSNLGRVGLTAPMPATFPIHVEVYLPDIDKRPKRLEIPLLNQDGGIRFVGRSGDAETRLVLTETTCDAICERIQNVDLNMVHPNAHGAVIYLRESGDLLLALERGVALPSPAAQTWKDMPSPSGSTIGEGAQKKIRTIGFVGNKAFVEAQTRQLAAADVYKAGILLSIAEVA
ncbi:MAG TPA: hypothetical protein VGG72_17090 [Bryobacteraceae bacterium]|jgi:hypothetical protein